MANARKGDGQTALITGASTGIGLGLAECFARDGYNVIIAARSEGALKEIAGRLSRENNIQATPIAIDLGVPSGGDKLAAEIRARGLDVDVLVNNAGFGIAGAFAEKDEGDQIGMMDLNNRALVELTHRFWPGMLKKKRGGVLNVASTAGHRVWPSAAVYCATKHAVIALSEGLRQEHDDLRVTVVSPGVTTSELAETTSDAGIKAWLEDFRQVAIPAEAIARAIAYAVEQPDDVDVSEVIVRPAASAN